MTMGAETSIQYSNGNNCPHSNHTSLITGKMDIGEPATPAALLSSAARSMPDIRYLWSFSLTRLYCGLPEPGHGHRHKPCGPSSTNHFRIIGFGGGYPHRRIDLI